MNTLDITLGHRISESTFVHTYYMSNNACNV